MKNNTSVPQCGGKVIKKTRRVIVDIEADSLHPTVIWCIVCRDVDTQEKIRFKPKHPLTGHKDWVKDFREFAKTVKQWIGHNILGYDIYHMMRLLDVDIKVSECDDTLVMSRLFRPVSPFKEQIKNLKTDSRQGGHSLEAWGSRLGFPKIHFNDFSRFTEEMLEYCERDVDLNYEVWLKLQDEGVGFSHRSIRLEHNVAWMLAKQQRNGFYLDQDACREMLSETTALIDEMLTKLQELFPPKPKLVRKWVAKRKKDGTLGSVAQRILKQYRDDPERIIEEIGKDTYNLYYLQEFNPKSATQIGERLMDIGWTPRRFTDKGNPRTDKETLKVALQELRAEMPDKDDVKYLEYYNIVADRQQKAAKWLELVEKDGRVHGNINPIGAGTHRCSHFNDNMANIAAVVTGSRPVVDFDEDLLADIKPYTRLDDKSIFLHKNESEVTFAKTGLEGAFGWDSRNCWTASHPDHCIVGADASGIQLRALAHYMGDPKYTKKLLEDDIHTVHQHAAGIATRPIAKTFIYAWLLGAGDEKVGSIVGVSPEEYEELIKYGKTKEVWGKDMVSYIINSLRRDGRAATQRLVCMIIKGHKVKEQFLDRTPALKKFKMEVIPAATKQGYCLGLDGRKLWIPSEHLAMSLYLQGFEAVIMKAAMFFYHKELEKLGIPFAQVAFVHDEYQVETKREYADVVGKTIVDAIKKAGEHFETRCPLDGEYKVGWSWAQTH